MPSPVDHRAFARDFHAALASDQMPGGLTAPDPGDLHARFAVYRNNVAHSLNRALARRFPVIERLVGAEFFAAMAAEFIRQHPPASPVLILWGEAFPGFLAEFPPVAGLPYLPDVARIEYARGRAYHAADIQPLDGAAALAVSEPAGLRLRLSPSVQVLDCSHPAVSIWQANQPGGDPAVQAQGAEWALIFRQRDFQVPVRRITPGEAAFLGALLVGRRLGTAATLLTDPTPMLALLLSEGLIAEVLQ